MIQRVGFISRLQNFVQRMPGLHYPAVKMLTDFNLTINPSLYWESRDGAVVREFCLPPM